MSKIRLRKGRLLAFPCVPFKIVSTHKPTIHKKNLSYKLQLNFFNLPKI